MGVITQVFCTFSETLTDVVNALLDTELPVSAYGAIPTIPATGLGSSHTRKSLAHIDCYMYDVISTLQDGPKRQHLVFYGTVCALKCILPSVTV